jgi:WD40 repeat protein
MLPLPSSGQFHYTVAFSPDGRWLAAGGSEHAIDVWDLHAPQNAARRVVCGDGPIVRAAFTPTGQLVVVSTGGVWMADSAMSACLRMRDLGRAYRAVITPDGAFVIVCGGMFQRCATFGPATGRDWARADDTSEGISDLSLAESGLLLAVGARRNHTTGFLEVRDPSNGWIRDTIPVRAIPNRVSCSANGSRAAVLAHQNLSVWDLKARTPVADRTNSIHGGWLSVAFAPRGNRIVTGGIDSTVAVWDAATDGPPLTTFQWGVGPVYAVTFDRDGLRVAAAGHSGAIVWDVDE